MVCFWACSVWCAAASAARFGRAWSKGARPRRTLESWRAPGDRFRFPEKGRFSPSGWLECLMGVLSENAPIFSRGGGTEG